MAGCADRRAADVVGTAAGPARDAYANVRAALRGRVGALMYVHPEMGAILPLHLLVILFACGRASGERFAFTGCVTTAFLLVVLPWIIRDRIAMGAWMFMRDDLGMELEVSNGAGSIGTGFCGISTRD
jgi:hypothetical protein